MPCQDILVVVDNPVSVAPRLAPAAALASRFAARLTGLFTTGYPMSPAYGDLAGWMPVIDSYMAARRTEGNIAETAFRQELARLQLAGDWLYREAEPTRGTIEAARLHDLVVLAQPDPDAASNGLRPEEVVLACGRPVVVIPYAGHFAELGRHVLVAWNGSREATRALHDAMFLIERAEAVTVVEFDAMVSLTGEPGPSAADVATFLSRRGIAAHAESANSDEVGVPDLLLSRAADLGADLVVMGAYGHSRLREYVLGGVSRSIFQQMTVPGLMVH